MGVASNRLVFSGSATNITTTVAATQFQDGTHIGTGTPGTDSCGANHAPNVKIVSQTNMIKTPSGGVAGSSIAINDGNLNLVSGEYRDASFRVRFNDAASVQLQNGRIYTYDGTTVTNEAVGVDAAIYVALEGMSGWSRINSDTATGNSMASMSFTSADFGGDNAGEFRALAAHATPATNHYYYVCLSVSPETAGGKSSFAVGAYLEYF